MLLSPSLCRCKNCMICRLHAHKINGRWVHGWPGEYVAYLVSTWPTWWEQNAVNTFSGIRVSRYDVRWRHVHSDPTWWIDTRHRNDVVVDWMHTHSLTTVLYTQTHTHTHTYIHTLPLSSDRQHLSYGDCLEVRGEIIRTVLCCIVYWKLCTLRWAVLTVLWIGFCLTGPISMCLDSFVFVFCVILSFCIRVVLL